METQATLSLIDYLVLALYLAGVAAIGLWVSRGNKTSAKYFIADRSMPQWLVGFTLMATLISSNTLVAHPAIVYQKAMILVPGFLLIPFILVMVAHYIVPFYRRVVGMSAYEYVGKRFGLGGRFYASFGFLMERTFDLGVTLVTTAIAIHVMTGWDIWHVMLGVGAFTMIYTSIGGITAVVWTDMMQGIVLMLGGVVILLRLLFAPELGAPFAAAAEAWEAGKFSFVYNEPVPASSNGIDQRTLGVFMLAMAIQWTRRYVCDQHMVQRYLIADSDESAKRGALTGALMSVPILIVFNVIGALLYGFYSGAGIPGPEVGDQVFPHFIVNFLPAGLVGLMLAAIIAASMSSMSSDLNSIATVLTRDYIQRLVPKITDRNNLAAGRLMVLIAGVLACLIGSQLIPDSDSLPLAERALTIAVIVSAGSLGLFMLGFLTRRATRRGAYAGIAACVLFTSWAVLTEPASRVLDLGLFNFPLNAMMIGVIGHLVVFGVGYLVSILFGGYRPDDMDNLIFRPAKVRHAD